MGHNIDTSDAKICTIAHIPLVNDVNSLEKDNLDEDTFE